MVSNDELPLAVMVTCGSVDVPWEVGTVSEKVPLVL